MGTVESIPETFEKIAQDMLAGFQTYFSTRRDKMMESARLFRDLHSCFKNIHDLAKEDQESHRRSDEIHIYAQKLTEIISKEMVPNIDEIVNKLKEIDGVEHLNHILNSSSDKENYLVKIEVAAESFDKMANMLEKGFKL